MSQLFQINCDAPTIIDLTRDSDGSTGIASSDALDLLLMVSSWQSKRRFRKRREAYVLAGTRGLRAQNGPKIQSGPKFC